MEWFDAHPAEAAWGAGPREPSRLPRPNLPDAAAEAVVRHARAALEQSVSHEPPSHSLGRSHGPSL